MPRGAPGRPGGGEAFVDTNVLYSILHVTPRTEDALDALDRHAGGYVIDYTVHNELLFTSTLRYLKTLGVSGVFAARKWIARHGYPEAVVEAVARLIEALEIRIVPTAYTEAELYEALRRYKLLPSDAIIALTCRHHGIDVIITFDQDFKRVPWLRVIP